MEPRSTGAPNAGGGCFSCRHFVVTWDPAFPRGCRAYAFRCQELPSSVVLRESGAPCGLFAPRQPAGSAPPPSPQNG